MKRIYLIIFIIIVSSVGVFAQDRLVVMAFNCENAFDALHDEGKNDYEYTKGGERNWGWGRLKRKLDGIAKVVAATDTVQPVGIVALCEVENDTVLTYLTGRTVLATLGYQYVMTNSPDVRGIDVALLYSRYKFNPVMTEYIRTTGLDRPTRDMLHVAGIVASGDTLDVYAVHLPSKLGGKKGVERSLKVARDLKNHVDSVLACRSKGHVVVLGDFNAEYNSRQIKEVLDAERYWTVQEHEHDRLYDVIENHVPPHMGTYKFRGVWSIIDHILVSGSVNVEDAGVVNSPFLLEDDDKFGGKRPRRTYVGYKYSGGISDHLPVWVRIAW